MPRMIAKTVRTACNLNLPLQCRSSAEKHFGVRGRICQHLHKAQSTQMHLGILLAQHCSRSEIFILIVETQYRIVLASKMHIDGQIGNVAYLE